MPDRTISILSLTAGSLVLTYLALMVTTVSMAAWRTDLAAQVRDAENAIVVLEHEYYEAIERVSATNPAAVGLVKPVGVTYAAMVTAPSLSRR